MLPKKHRLVKKEDFSAVFTKGSYAAIDEISIKYLDTGRKDTRIGFSVGKNYSQKATERNRARRVLRAACSSHLAALDPGYDIVVMIKPGKKNLKTMECAIFLGNLFKKAGLIKKSTD